MNKLENLKKKVQLLKRELYEVDSEVNMLETDLLLPSVKAMYEGRYFKCRSIVHSDVDPWWVYYHVTSVDNLDRFSGFSFQTNDAGSMIFQEEKFSSIVLLKKEISLKVFKAKVMDFKLRIDKSLPF